MHEITISAPTNWDPMLLHQYARLNSASNCRNRIYEVYAAACENPIGGGRPTIALPFTTCESIESHVLEAQRLGFEFNYLLNAPQFDNKEFTKHGYDEICGHIDWLAGLGIKKVTVATPLLLELCTQFGMRVEVSAVANVHTWNEFSRWCELGADCVNLGPERNRDFDFLRTLERAKVKILVNEICLLECPARSYHNNCVANASRTESRKGYIDYCILYCAWQKLRRPIELVKSPFVLPTDVGFYKEVVSKIKLSDRRLPTEKLTRIAAAYTTEEYAGNFFDIASMPIPEKQLLMRLYAAAGETGIDWEKVRYPTMHLDATEFGGRFLRYFLEGRCNHCCNSCGYCESWSDRIRVEHQEELIDILRQLRRKVVEGNLQMDDPDSAADETSRSGPASLGRSGACPDRVGRIQL